jgi:ribosomal protein S12 methylthiotransferase
MKINFVTFGCPKNIYYTQSIEDELIKKDCEIVQDPETADVIVINTCGFIRDSKKESIDGIYDFLEYRSKGKKIVALGCLIQRYSETFSKEISELDGLIGIQPPKKVAEDIIKISNEKIIDVQSPVIDYSKVVNAVSTYPYAYLLIADGCNHRCAYCAIPFIKGKYVSRQPDIILEEAKILIEKGEKEIILVAQDTTEYGKDLKYSFPKLLKKLDNIKGDFWIRILYAYPDKITNELLTVMKESKHILHYLDIPFQHSSPKILKSMRRPIVDYRKLIATIRSCIPDIVLRSTFIVGFPGETENDFNDLENFIREEKLDRAGIFVFSREDGTESFSMPNQTHYGKRLHRKKELMILQREISREINEKYKGDTLKILIEQEGDGFYIGRSYRDAPEIDGYVIIHSKKYHEIGDFISVKITKAHDYDLEGIELEE